MTAEDGPSSGGSEPAARVRAGFGAPHSTRYDGASPRDSRRSIRAQSRPARAAPAAIRSRVRDAVDRAWDAVRRGRCRRSRTGRAPAIEVERPANPAFGDVATNLAMKLARPLRRSPLEIAEALAERSARARDDGLVATAEVARPGFLNLRLTDAAYEAVAGILAAPGAWGRIPAVNPRARQRRVRVGQPDRAAHRGQRARGVRRRPAVPRARGRRPAGHARVLLQRLRGAGRHLGASVLAVRRGEPVPEDGYKGAYVEDLAARCRTTSGPRRPRRAPTPRTSWALGVRARPGGDRGQPRPARRPVRRVEERGARSTTRAGSSGRSSGCATAATSTSRTARRGSARPTFGDDKDRVIYRSDGRPTYFAADIGYVTEKFSRGFDHLIYIWGVDHHGTVARNKNAAQAMGYDPDHYQVLLIGWVRFVVDGVEVSMSKRAGTFVTLDDLLDAVGTDAARWFFASRAAHVEIDFDIELARKQSSENPVYYVQYAHARIASILRKAAEAGLAPAADVEGLLAGEPEAALVRASRGCRRSSRTRSRPRRRRASRPTRPSSRPSSTPSTATRGSSTRSSRSGRRSGSRWPWRRRRRSRTRSGCSGSPRPSRCSRGRPPAGRTRRARGRSRPGPACRASSR